MFRNCGLRAWHGARSMLALSRFEPSHEYCFVKIPSVNITRILTLYFFLANRPERECPSRRYVFERHARKRLKLPPSDLKEIMVANRTECEDKCLGEFSFVCRSATYDSALRTCSLSRFTRRTHPDLLEDDHNADYLENTCLNGLFNCIYPITYDWCFQVKILHL